MDQTRWVDYARVREEIDDLQAQLDGVPGWTALYTAPTQGEQP